MATPADPLKPIVIPQSARNYYTDAAYGADAATFTSGDGLFDRLGAYMKYGSQSDMRDLIGEAVTYYRQNPGEITYDASANQFTGFNNKNLKNRIPGGLFDGGQNFLKSPEFQQAFYKRLQQTDQQERLDAPSVMKGADGSLVSGPSLRERIDLLNQGDMNTAQLSGAGAKFVKGPDGKVQLNNSLGGVDASGRPVVGVLKGGGPGAAGQIDIRANPLLMQRAVAAQEKNQALIKQMKNLEGTGDLKNVPGAKDLLTSASVTRSPKLNEELAAKVGLGGEQRNIRQTNESTTAATRAADAAKYGAPGSTQAPTRGGQMEMDRHRSSQDLTRQQIATQQQTRVINEYNAKLADYNAKMEAYRYEQQRQDAINSELKTIALERWKQQQANKRAQWEYAENERIRQQQIEENEKQRRYGLQSRGIGGIFNSFYGSGF